MKRIILWMTVIMCMAPVTLQAGWGWGRKNKEEKKEHQAEQKQENKEFQAASKDKSPAEKEAAIEQALEVQRARNKAFQQAIRDKQMGELKAKLTQNTKLTEAQKNEILASRVKQAGENKAYEDQRRSENDTFFQKLSGDPTMTEEEKREAIREHFQSQKPANKAFREHQKAESQSEREKIRSEDSSSANTSAQ